MLTAEECYAMILYSWVLAFVTEERIFVCLGIVSADGHGVHECASLLCASFLIIQDGDMECGYNWGKRVGSQEQLFA